LWRGVGEQFSLGSFGPTNASYYSMKPNFFRRLFIVAVVAISVGWHAGVPNGFASSGHGVHSAALRKISVSNLRQFNGARLVAISSAGQSASVKIRSGKASITPPASKVRLYVVKNGEVVAVLGAKKPSASGQRVEAEAVMISSVFLAAARVVGSRATQGVILARGVSASTFKKVVDPKTLASLAKVKAAIASKGRGRSSASGTSGVVVSSISTGDRDKDGLHDMVDVDNDNDGVTDNYDSGSNDQSNITTRRPGFVVFSNLKLGIDQSLNLFTTGLDDAGIDAALRNFQTLAIGVAGNPSNPLREAELDCTGLSYCTPGGTGAVIDNGSSQTFPDRSDKDGDGFGTITPGSTGDFQLLTGAGFADIAAGDVLSQIFVDSSTGKTTRVTSMLNFIFVSAPAVKAVTTGLGANTIDYSAVPIVGSPANCIAVPAAGPVSVTIEGYRPQRPGVRSVGEGQWVDIGGSRVIIDVPNAPLATPSSPASAGPGNCRASSYSTTDPNLTPDAQWLQDTTSDRDASASNTFSFTVDLTDCLTGNPGGALTWNSGEYLFVDLQFRSQYGDNAAQKFCLRRQ